MLDAVVRFLDSSFANGVGNTASVLGLGLTLVAVLGISAVRRLFLLRARLPQLRKDLRNHVRELNRALREYDQSKEIVLVHLHSTASTMRSLARVATRTAKPVVRRAERSVKRYTAQTSNQTRESAYQVYATLRELEEELKNLGEDSKWR